MTNAKYEKLVTLATRAHTVTLNGQDEDCRDAWSAMRTALDAIGYRELVEAADRLVNNERWGTWMYHDSEEIERDAQTVRAALTQEQDT